MTADDHTTTLLVENAPVHFARTLDQMLAFLKARAPGADGKPDPAKGDDVRDLRWKALPSVRTK
jgi:hypothetical protein